MAQDPQTWKPVGGKGQYPPRGLSPEQNWGKNQNKETREKGQGITFEIEEWHQQRPTSEKGSWLGMFRDVELVT